jgi:predicted nucleic acid-binding protein
VILVDTSVWVSYLRGSTSAGARVLDRLLAEEVPVALSSVIAMELVQGVASEAMADTLATYLSTQRRIESEDPWATALAAAGMYAACRAAGYNIRSTLDCWIARLAIEHGHMLLHEDRDFDHLAAVVPELVVYRD